MTGIHLLSESPRFAAARGGTYLAHAPSTRMFGTANKLNLSICKGRLIVCVRRVRRDASGRRKRCIYELLATGNGALKALEGSRDTDT